MVRHLEKKLEVNKRFCIDKLCADQYYIYQSCWSERPV